MSDEQQQQADRAVRERPIQDEAWRSRAVELAGEVPLPVWSATRDISGHHGLVDSYDVASTKGDEQRYTVEIEVESGIAWCGCTANSYGRPCRHVGAVLQYRERERQAGRTGHECLVCEGLGSLGGTGACAACGGTGWMWDGAE